MPALTITLDDDAYEALAARAADAGETVEAHVASLVAASFYDHEHALSAEDVAEIEAAIAAATPPHG